MRVNFVGTSLRLALKGKYFRGDGSGGMLNIIFRSRVYDIGNYSNWGNLHTTPEIKSRSDSDGFAPVFESIRPSVEKSLANTIEAYS